MRHTFLRLGWVAAGLALLAAVAAPLRAERITPKNGSTFSGTIVKDEGARIIVRTDGGTLAIARDDVATVEQDVPGAKGPGPQVVPETVDPAKAAEALGRARKAMASGEWLKAGGLLEGLADLHKDVLSTRDRQAVAELLGTCYLKFGDTGGAARSFNRRALLEPNENEKRRLLAAMEALATLRSVRIGNREVRTYEEAIPAAVEWKAEALVEQAKTLATNARMNFAKGRLERTAKRINDTIEEADLYVPGTSSRRRREALEPLATNLVDRARRAIDVCSRERDYLDRNRWQSLSDKEIVKTWTGRVMTYLALRQGAEDGLKSLEALPATSHVQSLYNRGEVQKMIQTLDDLRYYPNRGGKRIRILPRRTAG